MSTRTKSSRAEQRRQQEQERVLQECYRRLEAALAGAVSAQKGLQRAKRALEVPVQFACLYRQVQACAQSVEALVCQLQPVVECRPRSSQAEQELESAGALN